LSHRVEKIHHVNFLVRDLAEAEARYRRLLGLGAAIREELPERGVLTARFRVGETWLVLVQPTSEQGAPARHLRQHGEGFFLISFAVEDLAAAMDEVSASGGQFASDQARLGLAGWKVVDLDPDDTFGAILQLTEDSHGS
jgi:methylmalonyl-CoA/ethylmalonyl-CoA epimerase